MSLDEIIKMARECGYWSGQTVEMNDVGLERFAALVAEAERKKTEHLVKDMLYVVEAFNRGCNSEDYYMEINEAIENAREWLEGRMSEKPEALRLAETLESFRSSSHRTSDGVPMHLAIASELRLLHAEVVEARTEIGNQARKCSDLRREIEAGDRNLCDLTDNLIKTVALLRQAQEALETDDWQKKMQASIDIKKHLESST